MQLIVLGMHRSGTSVVARLLNLMGAYLGPEGMSTGANPENPKGFWERRDVRLLNDAVLHSAGCDWDRVADLRLDAIPEQMTQAFEEVAGRILLEMDAHRPWFIKEPRLCLLLPLWLRHLEVPLVVNVHRDPVEVAASLHRRSAMPMQAGLELWEYYTRSAAAASRGLPSVTVLHAELMSEPEAVAARLYEALVGLGVQGLRRVTPREFVGFIDPRLHRERSGRDDLDAWRDGPQARLYRSLVEGVDVAPAEVPGAGQWPALREYARSLPPIQPPDPRRVRSAGYDAFMLDERLKSSVRRMARIEAGLAARMDVRFGQLESELSALRGDGATVIATGTGTADGTPQSPLAEAIAARERAEAELAQRYGELAEAARALAAARGEADRHAEAGKKLRKLRQQREREQEQAQALHSRLKRERGRSARLEQELAALTGSRSWRMTAPLRALVSGLRVLLRR